MKKVLALTLLATVMSAPSLAAGDAEAGKAKAAVCAACHGADGVAMIPGYPNLKGQNEQYLVSALKAYKNKERNGGMAAVMQPQAAMLSDTDMVNVAAYFSQMK
ncbi:MULTISPECIES: c-type cytochrome [Photobacterium]|uniref:Cytochrome C biogenesis protein CcsB n=1 Tax=Photobacterium ganghwense TaxID=320778 RepID=A0A0J1HJD9_9GAMM|nr:MULTISPECIES: c-type cytochrome [Photobacterium]KLV11705.1 cytochrome C biogenesis protein CcsB [Photobacterium ganghwense]MBV1840506.1 c-type cytochrome [Photobacterium ganghwense]PSU04564.1 cytochrome C biogenesis protein CcsB [Photobacterium ganghwense]QSV14651.1 c-type cytochrome [Photobacterium ganghwense]